MKIFSGTSNKNLTQKVCEYLDKKVSDANISKFSDGEIKIVINENVRKMDCFIIQSTGPSESGSPNDNYMELFILIDALKRGRLQKNLGKEYEFAPGEKCEIE